MINLYEKGAYLVNGTELVDEDNTEKLAQLTGSALSKEEARQNTIAYGILSDHNTSGNMDKLMIKYIDFPRYYICRDHTDGESVRDREIPGSLCAH